MAINERLIDTAVSGCSAEPPEEGLQLHLDANDVDSYDGDGDEWIDITTFDKTIPISDNADDLELYLNASDSTSYGGSGTTWTDISGNSNDGTISGATFDTDNGGYFDFDGSNDEVSLNSGNTISASTFDNCTFEYWIKLDNLSEGRHLYFHDYTSNSVNYVGLSKSNTNNKLMVFGSSGHINIASGNTNLVANIWTHIAVTLTSSQLKIYINGQLDATVSQSFNGFSNPLYGTIGVDRTSQSATGNKWLNGQVGQVRVYSSELSASDIGQNYRHGRDTVYTDLIPDTDLELHLDAASFDGSTNTPSTWTDSSSNSNNGTITGATFDSELGNWLTFTGGSNHRVTVDDNGALTNVSNFTVEMWMNIKDNNSYRWLCTNMDTTNGKRQVYVVLDTADRLEFATYNSNSSSNYRINRTNSVASKLHNKWSHLAFVLSGGKVSKIYINGEEESITYQDGSDNQMHTSSTTDFVIGSLSNIGDTDNANGDIGQVRMYHSALTQAQIRQNYNFTKPSYPNGHNFIGNNMDSADWNTNGYFSFNGTNESFSDTSFTPSLTDVQTVSYWVRNSAISGKETVFSIGQTGNSNSYVWISFGYDSTAGQVRAFYGDRIGDLRNGTKTNSAYISSDWQHHCFLIFPENRGTSSQCFKVYIDGVEVAVTNSTTSQTLPTVQGYPIIGRYSAQVFGQFSGDLSSLRVYDRRLTEAEITALHCKGR
jgi:hypothetical protein